MTVKQDDGTFGDNTSVLYLDLGGGHVGVYVHEQVLLQ